jgi:hypothetical protein
MFIKNRCIFGAYQNYDIVMTIAKYSIVKPWLRNIVAKHALSYRLVD